ncbi:hypothetical protein [Actomonas aquatica]|uniref:Uncharacterized protein n=1 Tax=Actomonas aquatica TaxID=2866162 RepID=A0ABZ1CA01_9BACT|nr:hypothetical protein [Opitutus sp. WL0086]WRQ88058.1 hypothetical protein K1X11_001480 [Opitutus sp. WL0086]
MTADIEFEKWRQAGRKKTQWGLAWYLALQVCRRYYRSHGIKPVVIQREGLGYYGIALAELSCSDADPPQTFGRFTIAGNVENWIKNIPGGHDVDLETLCASGTSTPELIQLALRHFELPLRPEKSHAGCRHHRWSDSYVLLFEVMTILALRRSHQDMTIWNGDWDQEWCRQRDPLADMRQHPGYFEIDAQWRTQGAIAISGDGRLLDGSSRNLWEEFMEGASASNLASAIEQILEVA